MSRRETWQGMNWCRPSTRLAIYLRDGLACLWCGAGVEDEVVLTLDHVVPVGRGGDNRGRNLITACRECNAGRGTASIPAFASRLAQELLPEGDERASQLAEAMIMAVRAAQRRNLPREAARYLLARRGGRLAEVLTSVDELLTDVHPREVCRFNGLC